MKTLVSSVVALVVGAVLGYLFNPSVDEPQQPGRQSSEGSIADEGAAAEIGALNARIADLEAKLAEKGRRGGRSEEKSADRNAAGGEGSRREERGPWGQSMTEWRERFKKENPERYAQLTNGFARMRRDRQARAQRKADFLASLDVSEMPESARSVHNELQELIAKSEELEQRMHAAQESGAEPSREEMGQFFREMHETNQRIRELNVQERDNLMAEAVKGLGFNDSEASEVVGVFQEIIENTEGGRGGHWGHGGPGGQGGFGPPPMGR